MKYHIWRVEVQGVWGGVIAWLTLTLKGVEVGFRGDLGGMLHLLLWDINTVPLQIACIGPLTPGDPSFMLVDQQQLLLGAKT